MSLSSRHRHVCRLSPNEEAAALHKQRNERRKARLLQVRQQEKEFARSLREEVKSKKEQERVALQEHLDAALIASHEDELRELESHYLTRMGQMGRGHIDAQHISDEHNRVQELRLLLEAEQRWRAEERHKSAMKELTSNKLVAKEAKQRSLKSKKKAMEVERERAKHVATTKPHATQPLIMDLVVGKGRRVHLKEAEGYASTYYHIPDALVRRVDSPEWNKRPNANEMAQAKTEEDEIIQKHLVVSHQEQLEKARLRHKHALAKVKLEREKADVLNQLKTLERQDRTHRQKSLAKMPVNLFQPAHRRGEIISEQERDMEQAFEKLFVKTHGPQSSAQLALSHLASEPNSVPSLEDLESSHDGEQSDHQRSTLVNSGSLKDHPQPIQPLLNTKPHSDDAKHHEPEPTTALLQTGRSKSPIIVPHTDPSNFIKQTVTSPDLYDSNYSSPSLTTPTGHTPSTSNESSDSHVFNVPPAPLSLPYPSLQSPSSPNEETRVHPPNQTLEDSDTSSESPDYPKHNKPTVKFSLVPTFHSASSESPLYTPPTQHTSVPALSQQSDGHFISTSLPQPPDLSITAMTSLDTQETSSSFVDTPNDPETDPSLPTRVPTASIDPWQLEAANTADGKGATSDGMQKLVSMIRSQHQAWNKRLLARSNLLSSQRVSSSSSSSSLSSSSGSHPLSQAHTATTHALQTSTNNESKAQDQSLSVFTLSTRGSTVSPQDLTLPDGNAEHLSSLDEVAVPHSHDGSSSSTSPQPLSISPYHTTLELSSLTSPIGHSQPDTNTDHNLHVWSTQQQHYGEAEQLIPLSTSQTSVSTMGNNDTPTSMFHPTLHSHNTLEHMGEHVHVQSTSTGNSADDMHREDSVETTISVPYTSPNVSMHLQATLSPIREETSSQDVATLPSITTMPSLSYLELPSHLSMPDKPPLPTPSTNACVLLTPSDLDLTASTTNPPSPPSQASSTSPNGNMSHSTPSHSRGSSPQLVSPHTPLSPVLGETVCNFDQQRIELRGSPHDVNDSDLSSEVGETCDQVNSQTDDPQQLIMNLSQGENEHHSQSGSINTHQHYTSLHEATVGRDHLNTRASFSTSTATPMPPNKTMQDTVPSTSLSLQEAFLKKKEEFVQRSRARLQQIKTAAEKRQVVTAPVFNVRGKNKSFETKQKVSEKHKPLSSSTHHEKAVSSVSPGKKAVTFSSPLLHEFNQLKPQGSRHPPILSSQGREKIKRKEMRERNMRFYSQLPEVKRKREEEARLQTYSANRERAKQYQQKIRSKSMSKAKPQDSKKIVRAQDTKQTKKQPLFR